MCTIFYFSKEHYSHYHSHAKSCDVETAHTLLEVVEAERVAMYEDENENSARPMTVSFLYIWL